MSLKLCLYLLIYQTVHSIDITCVTEESTASPGGDNTQTSVQCSNSAYTLVSCGFKTVDTTENDVGGSWISGQTCYADNVDSDQGAIAIARCCDLTAYSVTCNTLESAISGTTNDNKIDVSCSSSQTLMGCTARAIGMRMDGMYPGKTSDNPFNLVGTTVTNPDSCTGWNAENGGGIRSYATCCSSSDTKVTFQCDAVYSPLTSDTSFSFPCANSNQFMTSCTAADGWRDMNRWKIDANTHQCKPRNSHRNYNQDGFGAAICCTVTTEAPTKTPTTSPTKYPTISPSKYPSISPSKFPSISPSKYPSISPSKYPTKSPTKTPIKDPTQSPTKNPSKNPTQFPTKNPTKQPSIFPTKYPTKQPTKSPSKYPTPKPTISPTIEERNAGVNEETTQTPEPPNTGKNNGAKNTEKKGFLGGEPMLDYLLYIVVGLIFIICLLCCCMVIQKKRNEKHVKDINSEMTKMNSISAVESQEINLTAIKSSEIDGENEPETLPAPPLRSPKGPNGNGVNGAVVMNIQAQYQQQQLINMNMAMKSMPIQPVVNNEKEYIEGLNVGSVALSTPNGVTTQGNDLDQEQKLNSNVNESESESDGDDEIYKSGRNSTAQ